jgi:CRP-like cAMP-binding protein
LIYIKEFSIFVANATIMIHENFKKLLKSLSPFTDKELDNASSLFEVKEVKKNIHYLREGETSGDIGFVIEGLFRCYYIIKGKEITTEFLLPNSIVAGMLSFLAGEPQRENIIALENSKLITISRDNLFRLYENDWKWQQAGRILTELNFIRVEKRGICLQTLNARERYAELLKEMPGLIDRVPLQYIASYLGMSPETFSRIRSKKT